MKIHMSHYTSVVGTLSANMLIICERNSFPYTHTHPRLCPTDSLERAAWRPPRPVAQCRQFQEEAKDASVSECTWILSALAALRNALYTFKTYLLSYLRESKEASITSHVRQTCESAGPPSLALPEASWTRRWCLTVERRGCSDSWLPREKLRPSRSLMKR